MSGGLIGAVNQVRGVEIPKLKCTYCGEVVDEFMHIRARDGRERVVCVTCLIEMHDNVLGHKIDGRKKDG